MQARSPHSNFVGCSSARSTRSFRGTIYRVSVRTPAARPWTYAHSWRTCAERVRRPCLPAATCPRKDLREADKLAVRGDSTHVHVSMVTRGWAKRTADARRPQKADGHCGTRRRCVLNVLGQMVEVRRNKH
jgi:hypothetical protein